MYMPQMTERLIICNLPHPRGLGRELATNPEQQRNSNYAREFQKEGAHEQLTAEGLAGWVTDPAARAKYVEAFEHSDFEAMLNYYKRNYPRTPPSPPPAGETDPAAAPPAPANMPRVSCSILMIHGLDHTALLPAGLNDTWEWVDGDLTITTVPGAGHFVQQDAADLVSRSMRAWLDR